MVTDAANAFIGQLTVKTTKDEIEWKPLSELYPDVHGFPDFLSQIYELIPCSEFDMIYKANSFFFFHKQGIVALLRVEHYSGKDGSRSTSYELALQIRENYPTRLLCQGLFQDSLEILYMAILDYVNRDISLPDDLYAFLNF